MNKKCFQELASFNGWADQKTIGWLMQISDQQWEIINNSSFNSVRNTVLHIVSAEKIWVDFWTAVPNPFYLSTIFTGTRAELLHTWNTVSSTIRDYTMSVQEAHLQKSVQFFYPDGRIAQLPFYQTVTHIVNHTSYHRGQLVTLLRQTGFTQFSSVDLATYYLEHQPSSSELPPSTN